jgi:hypothetical protein
LGHSKVALGGGGHGLAGACDGGEELVVVVLLLLELDVGVLVLVLVLVVLLLVGVHLLKLLVLLLLETSGVLRQHTVQGHVPDRRLGVRVHERVHLRVNRVGE